MTEDLFVNLWINHDSIDASKSFSSYLHTIARNLAINFLKHKYVHDTYLNSSQEIEYSSTSEEDLIAKELGLLIDDIVGKMPEPVSYTHLDVYKRQPFFLLRATLVKYAMNIHLPPICVNSH